jgi:hypothetical protein
MKKGKYKEWLSSLSKEGLQKEFDKKSKSYMYQSQYEGMYKRILSGEEKHISGSNSQENALKHEKNRKKIEKQLTQIKEIACEHYHLCD